MEKYFFGVVIAILLVSVFLNLNYSFNNRTLQARIDFMSSVAFQSWLDNMKKINSTLKFVKTNLDVEEAVSYTSQTNKLASVLEAQIEISRPPDFAEHLYLKMSDASWMLNTAVSAIVTKPPTTPQILGDKTLQRIGNITLTIENLVEAVGTMKNEPSPVQQLEEKGVLNLVINYLKQITATSTDIWTDYGYYGM